MSEAGSIELCRDSARSRARHDRQRRPVGNATEFAAQYRSAPRWIASSNIPFWKLSADRRTAAMSLGASP
jgi:hypothetical protein